MKNYYRLYFPAIVFLIAGLPALLAADVHHSVNFSRSDLNLTEKNGKDDVTYMKCSMPGLRLTGEIGAPELPVHYVKLIIPSGQDVREVVINSAAEDEIPGDYLIYPAQPPMTTCIDCKQPEFVTPDVRVYESDKPYPAERIKVVRDVYFDGSNHIVTLAAYPLQYYPESGRLEFTSSIDFTLEFKPSEKTPIRVQRRSKRGQSVYNTALKSIVDNDHDIPAYQVLPHQIITDCRDSDDDPCLTADPPFYEYVIITTATLKEYFNPIVQWRITIGVNAGVVVIDDILSAYPEGDDISTYPIVDAAGSVRKYLSEAYNCGTVWALIAGPIPEIPFRYGWGLQDIDNVTDEDSLNVIPADLYLAEFDGDWDRDGDMRYGELESVWSEDNDVPDYEQEIFIGRLICSNDLHDIVHWRRKLLIYEQFPGYDDFSHLVRSFMIQSDDMQFGSEAQLVESALPPAFTTKNTIWEEKPSYDDSDPDFPYAAEVINEMNNTKYGLYSWFGHGNTRDKASGVITKSCGIAHPDLCFYALNAEDTYEIGGTHSEDPEDNDGLDDLTNFNYPSVLYSVSCVVTPFDRTKAFNNKGARNCGEGFTVNTEGGGVAFLGNTRIGGVGNSAVIYFDFARKLSEGITNLGVAEALSKSMHSDWHSLVYSHNLVGCPYMEMWTNIPSYFEVSHPIQVPTLGKSGNRGFDVTVRTEGGAAIEGAFVCISGEGISITGETGAGGVFSTENLPTSVDRLITVAVTKHNYIPYVGLAKLCGGDDDLLIKDCENDNGRMPSWDANHNGKWDHVPPDRANWVSPSIKVDIGCDGDLPDGHPDGDDEQNPKRGCINHFYVYVENIGSAAAANITVEVYWGDYQFGTPHWDDFTKIGEYTITDHELGPGAVVDESWGKYVNWEVENWDEIPEHTCIWALASCPTDPIPEGVVPEPGRNNNVGWKNFWIEQSDDGKGGKIRSQASTDIAVVNTGSEVEHTITVFTQSEDIPAGWDATLNSTDPMFPFTSVDCSRYGSETRLNCQYDWAPLGPGETRNVELVVQIPPSTLPDTATINVYGLMTDDTLAETPVGGVTYQVVHAPSAPIIRIEKTHDTYQGHFEYVSITVENSDYEMGGFDFLVAYDASALAFIEATPGQLLGDCGWEYFTYRYGADGNCGDACPSGLLRIIAMAETNNGPNHPSCYGPLDADPHELAEMKFFVTNDRTFNCQYVPLRFFWMDCNDNAISSVTGDTLLVSEHVFEFDGTDITDSTFGFPTYFGIQSGCLEGGGPDKPAPIPFINFVDGGIDIICSDSIDVRGDINVNGVENEIADAVMFTNYFITGLSAFGDHVEASIAASDVNADGIALSVADLVYLVRVITGDAPPYPKVAPYAMKATVSTLVNHSAAAVSTNSSSAIGAGYFVFNHSGFEIGEPQLINGATEMTLKYSNEDGVLKVLVYSLDKGIKIAAGTENIFAVPISGEGTIKLTDVQLSDYFGNLLEATIDKQTALPTKYALHQNYPNPFNAATTIMYELPVATHVTIEIFNILGQKVTTLLDDQEAAGIHSLTWDGTDESGTTVSSGVYFYRISTPDFTSEKKMVLMK